MLLLAISTLRTHATHVAFKLVTASNAHVTSSAAMPIMQYASTGGGRNIIQTWGDGKVMLDYNLSDENTDASLFDRFGRIRFVGCAPDAPTSDPDKNGATGSHPTLLESGYPPGYDGGLIRNESDMSVVGGSGHDRM